MRRTLSDQCLLKLWGPNDYQFNFKASPFVTNLDQLGGEIDQFKEEEEVGDILVKYRYELNILHCIADSHSSDEKKPNQRFET